MFTVPEVAQRLGRSPETIRRWIRAGKLRASKVGTQHAIDEADLAAFLRGRQTAATTGEATVPYGADAIFDLEPNPLLRRLTTNPQVLAGKPAIKGTRISVELILENLSAGWSMEDILDSYPHISEEDVRACIAYAAALVASEEIIPAIHSG
jgi:excisionase family DNA binding protein